jgi:glycine hydroxymethyltransferase
MSLTQPLQESGILRDLADQSVEMLSRDDPTLYGILHDEYLRQASVLSMVASSSVIHPSVLACEAMISTNVTAEGYPGARFHAGCKHIDRIEQLAIDRARSAFQAEFANVQPLSASAANLAVICSLLKPGDTLLGMALGSGGHLTHGSKPSLTGQFFNAVGYGVNDAGLIHFDEVRALAQQHRPKLIICGATAHPRRVDFQRFRAIADEVGAYLLADITHIAGLVVAGEHPSPVDVAHITTTCTHKQLFGPRGGLILMGRDHGAPAPDGKQTLAQWMQKSVFPFFQSAPAMNNIAAKARTMARIVQPEFRALAQRIRACATSLADCLMEKGYTVVTNGTDNHIVLVDVRSSQGITGVVAERALEECQIIVNKNQIPGDQKSALVASGVRLGTNSLAARKMGGDEMRYCTELIHRVLSATKAKGTTEYELDDTIKRSVQEDVTAFCQRFPLPHYPNHVDSSQPAF